MLFTRSTEFKKKFKKSSIKIRAKIEERLAMFAEDPWNPVLDNHSLHGEYVGCRSINITGDMRLVFEDVGNKTYLLIRFGTHHELYGN